MLVSVAMLAFAANSVLNRLALANGLIGPSGFALIRLVSGAAVLAGLVWWQSRKPWDLAEVSFLSVIGLAAYVLGFAYAYQSLEAGIGALILFGVVQVTMFAGGLMSGERPALRRWIGALVAFGGLAYLLAPSASAPDPLGVFLMALAGFGWGYYSLYGRGVGRPLASSAGNFLLATPIALVFFLLFQDATPATAQGVGLAVTSGAVTSGLGYALWYSVLPRLEASQAAVAQLCVPMIAMVGGILFLGESLTVGFAAASVFILGGVGLSVRR